MIDDLDIYVICNPSLEIRKDNMHRRLSNIGLINNTIFITSVCEGDSLYEHYDNNGCLVGHIKALRSFIKSHKEKALILEDDILFHDEFKVMMNDILDKYLDKEIIQLYTMSFIEEDSSCEEGVYGTQGYIIQRSYAIEWLTNFDKPPRYWPDTIFKSSEAITMYSQGIVIKDPPIIEDNLSYSNGHSTDHRIYYNMIPSYENGLHKYLACDPLFKLPSNYLPYLYDIFVSDNLISEDLYKICQCVEVIEGNIEGEMLLCSLYMLCCYYINKSEADIWASRLKQIITPEFIEKHDDIKYILSFF